MDHQTSGQVIRDQAAALAEAIVTRQYQLQAEIWHPSGLSGRAKSVRDAAYHLTYLAEALAAEAPALFVEYVAWVKALFAGLNFREDVLTTTLELTRKVLIENLPAEQALPALAYLDAGLDSLQTAPRVPASFLRPDAPWADLAARYLRALLDGERRAASEMILRAVTAGAPIREIYLHVFQPVQHEIGRLWQTNQISVAQEHFCTATTQMVMSQLYPYIFSGERQERCLVAGCVGGELHELGARMVADFFEMSGWNTYYLGANTPPESILRTLLERRADVLALSATMTFHVSKVADLIAAVRRERGLGHVRILVGGYPFNLSPGLWQRVGADGYAASAETAIVAAEKVLAA